MTSSQPKKSNRRQFLQGLSAVDAAADVVHQLDQAEYSGLEATQDHRDFLIPISRRAMACKFEIILNAGEHGPAVEAAIVALDLIDQLEDQLSVYRDESEVSRLNQRASEGAVVVEAGLFQLLLLAVDLYEQTSGAFDITAGPLTRLWGFYRREGDVPTEEAIAETLRSIGSSLLQLGCSDRTVSFLDSEVEINLGGIGKGYAVDRAAKSLTDEGVDDFLFHGGQSSVLARGDCQCLIDEPNGWLVGIRHPTRPEQRLATVRLHNEALGTSGSGTQSFRHQGKKYGHILDPRTGHPAEGVLSATVVAPTAAMADALATACYVLGKEEAVALCQQRNDFSLLIVTSGKRTSDIEITAEGFAEGALRLME